MDSIWKALGCLIMAGLLFVFCVVMFVGCGYVRDAAETTFHETKASTLIKRYAWFKDAAARLDAYKADIQVYERRFDHLKEAYEGQPRSKWSREDREQSNLWEQEVAGIRAGYNGLAAEYNAAMAKANFAFCNVGDLPRGAEVPLPREFKPYESK